MIKKRKFQLKILILACLIVIAFLKSREPGQFLLHTDTLTTNSEWLQLAQKIFLKKNTAVHFLDQKRFSIMFVSSGPTFKLLKSYLNFKLTFIITLDSNITENLVVTQVDIVEFHANMGGMLNSYLDLEKYQISENQQLKLNISLYSKLLCLFYVVVKFKVSQYQTIMDSVF